MTRSSGAASGGGDLGRIVLRLVKLVLRLGALAVGLGIAAVVVGELMARLRAAGAALGAPSAAPPVGDPAPAADDEEDRVLRALADSSLFLQEVGAVHQRLRDEEYGAERVAEPDEG